MNAEYMANATKENARQLQNTLYLAAKENPKRKFHALYDKVFRKDILQEAWARVKTNRRSAGIDGVTLGVILHLFQSLSCTISKYKKAQFLSIIIEKLGFYRFVNQKFCNPVDARAYPINTKIIALSSFYH